MPANRSIYAHGEVRNITFRAEENLPVPPTWYMNRLLEGLLCEAQTRYPVEVIAFKFMANHIHMLIRVLDPVAVKRFLQYLKRESSHYVNRLLGRRKRTIWEKGSDDPVVLDIDKIIECIAYIYANAAAADLTDSVDEYPGLCSWGMFLSEERNRTSYRISRDAVKSLGEKRVLRKHQQLDLIACMEERTVCKSKSTFTLTPFAFLRSFTEVAESKEEIRAKIIRRVRESEQIARVERKDKPVLGARALRLTPLNRPHTPKKYGRRMLCLSSFIELRTLYINAYRALRSKAEEIYMLIKETGRLLSYPPGVFAPGGYVSANLYDHKLIYKTG